MTREKFESLTDYDEFRTIYWAEGFYEFVEAGIVVQALAQTTTVFLYPEHARTWSDAIPIQFGDIWEVI